MNTQTLTQDFYTHWGSVCQFLVQKKFVSPQKCYRFTADGNYCTSLVERGKLIEGIHWQLSQPIRAWDSFRSEYYYYQTKNFSLKAIEKLYRDGFVDDPEIWVAFNERHIDCNGTPCQWDVSEDLHQKILDVGCRWSGYSQLLQRKYYTAPSLVIAQRGMAIARANTLCDLADD